MFKQHSNLFIVLDWLQKEGEAQSINRLRIKILPFSIKEGIVLSRVERATACSPELLNLARKAASEIVGKPCPY